MGAPSFWLKICFAFLCVTGFAALPPSLRKAFGFLATSGVAEAKPQRPSRKSLWWLIGKANTFRKESGKAAGENFVKRGLPSSFTEKDARFSLLRAFVRLAYNSSTLFCRRSQQELPDTTARHYAGII
jgi:hypothetical protein